MMHLPADILLSDEDRQAVIASFVRKRGHEGTTEEERQILLQWAQDTMADYVALMLVVFGTRDVDLSADGFLMFSPRG